MKKVILFFFTVLISQLLFAQQTYIQKGKIEFEKTVNVHKILEEFYKTASDATYLETFKKTMPATGVSYFDLSFNGEKSLYKPGREVTVTQRPPDWVNGQATDNVVFNDLVNNRTATQKNVFENTYLVQDSLRTLNWKISNDTRTIAGLECRKATAIIMDSVFVVAFFTEQILCTSGPEGFNGLPGMILGVVIPRMHVTWYATKLELVEVKDTELAAPKKGKPINNGKLHDQLKELIKDWYSGRNPNRNIWQIMI
jgi:GLPGLI family protein